MSEENNAADQAATEVQTTNNEVPTDQHKDTGTLLEQAQDETNPPKSEGDGEPTSKDDGQKADGEKAPEGAPESYEAFTTPEGVELDHGVMTEFSGIAKEFGLSQEKAQGVLDRMLPVMAQRQMEYIQEVAKGWAERTQNDKEVGGTNFQASLAAVARIRDHFSYNENGEMDPDIKEFLSSPMGNHPGAVKLLARAGHSLGEAKFPQGTGGDKVMPTAEDFYASARKK
mgnify:CR=1 FL=1